MKSKYLYILFILLVISSAAKATGVMLPSAKNYPKDLLRLKTCEVTVNINGLIAETTVYQEFVNEWSDSTDAVYSFPLPENARATDIVYWYKGTAYKAILKVREQSTNPGTGEGGIAALINKYIGTNGIKIELKSIQAGAIQAIQLKYVSICDYYAGKVSYSFPMNTGDFIKYPLDNVKFNVNINSSTPISNYKIENYSDFKIADSSQGKVSLQFSRAKLYIDQDLKCSFDTDINKLGVDFYSAAADSGSGHFTLIARPQNQAVPDSIIKKCIVFILSNNTSMGGANLEASKAALVSALDMLSPKDYFNFITSNYYNTAYSQDPVQATAANIASVKQTIRNLSTSYGSNLNDAVKLALQQLKDNSFNNAVVIITEGGSNLDPKSLAGLNTRKAGIFPVGIGEQISRARLEMTASQNFGFTTYIGPNENISDRIVRVVKQISQPIIKDTRFEFGRTDLTQLVPSSLPTTYAGSYFLLAGRYSKPGLSPLSVAGYSASGVTAFDFMLDFSAAKTGNQFVKSLWAKETMDAIEREIEVYGESGTLKQQLIDLSLKYNIRCRYTAYIADYKTVNTSVEGKNAVMPSKSFIAGNYPNPFNPSTKIRIYLSDEPAGQVRLLKIYNILGQLVMVIDITHLRAGWNEVMFNGRDMYGSQLPSGIYFVRLETNSRVESTIRINLVK